LDLHKVAEAGWFISTHHPTAVAKLDFSHLDWDSDMWQKQTGLSPRTIQAPRLN
jgi:hypothetical protein